MKWSETWGDVVWRHNMLVLLSGAAVIVVGLLAMWALTPKAQAECPPEWQCNGSPQTNNPRCCL